MKTLGLFGLLIATQVLAGSEPRFDFALPVEVKLAVGFKGDNAKAMGSVRGTLHVHRASPVGEIVLVNGQKISIAIDYLMLAEPEYCTPTITSLMWNAYPEAVPITSKHLGRYHPHLSFQLKVQDLKLLAKAANNAWYRNDSTKKAASALLDKLLDAPAPTDRDAPYVWAHLNGADEGLSFRDYPLSMSSAPDSGCNYRTDNSFKAAYSGKDADSISIELNTDELGALRLE